MNLRWRQLRRFFVALAAVIVAFLGYSATVVPWIEGPPRQRLPLDPSDNFDPLSFKADLLAWLPQDAWERGSCKQLSTRSGHIFYQEYRSFDDGRVELKPLTLILPPSGADASQPPIVLRAPDGAVLKLDRPLSLGGKSVQLESGQVLGPITVYRAATRPDGGDAWQIQTGNIQLSKQKIQTIEEVAFQFGPHRGRGRNLVIELETDPLRAQQQTMTGIRGVRRIELVQVQGLHFAPEPPGSPKDSNAPSQSSQTAASRDYPNGFDATCSGPFEFDLQTGLAVLRGDVNIVSVDQTDDWMTADAIELRLAPQSGGANDVAAKKWSPQEVRAVGRPATIQSASRQLLVRGEQLKFDSINQIVEVIDPRGVELRQASSLMSALAARYQITSDGSLGAALLKGPGVLRRAATDQQPPLEIQWRDTLSIDPDGQQKLVSLTGGAQILLDGQPKLTADSLRVWLWELAAATVQPGTEKWTWHPDRLLAAGNVRLASANVNGAVDELRAQWPKPVVAAPPLPHSGDASGVRSPTSEQSRPSAQPNLAESLLASGQPKADQPPISFRGQTAAVQFLDASSGQFRDAVIDGDVRVQQLADEGTPALDISGQRLRITPQKDQRYRLVISGSPQQPSSVQAGQLTLRGEVVQLDQTANRLWIEGPGSMQGQQAAANDPTNPTTTPETTVTSTIEVRWTGGMVFDGRQIYFEDDVRTTCQQAAAEGSNRIEAHSAAINVTLQPSIDLSGSTSATANDPPKLEVLTLVGEVPASKRSFAAPQTSQAKSLVELVRQATDASGQIASLQKLSVPWGQVNAISGQLSTTGPGSVSIWALGESLNSAAVATPRKIERADDNRLTNTTIHFEDSITGNIRQSNLTFKGKVRTIHGSVPNWDAKLDADRTRPQGDTFLLLSDELQITQWQRSAAETAHVEIIALGQARLEGETFEADAERIGYNQSQDKIVMEGDPRNGARLTYESTPGGERNPLVASKIAYSLRDNTVQVDGFKHGVLTTGPLLQRR